MVWIWIKFELEYRVLMVISKLLFGKKNIKMKFVFVKIIRKRIV